MKSTTKIHQKCLQAALLLISCSAALACHGTILVSGITDEERRVILQEHNRLRQTVATGQYPGQPAAENMREIVWDDELALRAQKWADNCQFRHDPYRTINRFTMGQNIAIIWSTVPLDADDGDFPSRIQNWFNEVQKYSFGDAWSRKTGHYSQLVWGETNLIGCGYAEYKDATKYNKLYVCNYGPGGNVVGFNPYVVGKPSCRSYGMKPSSRYQGLCSAPQPSTGTQANTLDTYDYKHTIDFNTKKSSYSSQFLQQQQSPFTQQAFEKVSTSSSLASATSAVSSQGSSNIYNNNQYQSLESFGTTSPTDFPNSLLKHTIFRSFLNPSGPAGGSHPTGVVVSQPLAQSPVPPRSGWSLLTWRG